MPQDDRNIILVKVQKLMERAKLDTGHEADQAALFARRMMLKHAIDMREVEGLKSRRAESIGSHPIADIGGRERWRVNLLHACALYCECRTSFVPGTPKMNVYGYYADAEVAVYLYVALSNQLHALYSDYRSDHKYDYGQVPSKTDCRNWYMSAVAAVKKRLSEMTQTAKDENPQGHELVCLRGSQVRQWVRQNCNLVNARRVGYEHNEAGEHAGRSVNISAGIGSDGRSGPGQLEG